MYPDVTMADTESQEDITGQDSYVIVKHFCEKVYSSVLNHTCRIYKGILKANIEMMNHVENIC